MAAYRRVDETPVLTWVIVAGIVPLYATIGFSMTGYINFWLGIAILCLTAAIFAVFFCLANKSQSRHFRGYGVAAILAGLAITLCFVLVRAPIQVIISEPSGAYPKGTRILGLEWNDDEMPVRFTVTNDTGLSYENFDSYYQTTSKFIATAGVYGGINTCVATPENPAIILMQSTLSAGETSIPIFEPDQKYPATIYRVRCDKIAPHSHIDIVLAVADKTKPTWAIGSFRYDAANRHRGPLFYSKCFVTQCPDLPSTIIGN